MNCDRYLFYFIYIIFNHYNEMKIKRDKRNIEFWDGLVQKTIMEMALREFALALGNRRYCDS